MKKKLKLLVAGLIITSILIISNITYSRYILTRNFGANIATAPFYFDAYSEDEKNIVIDEEDVYFNLHVRNFIDDDVTLENISYIVTLSDDEPADFNIEILPEKERTNLANSKWDDLVKIKLSPKLDKEINFDEPIPITITVTSRKPYRKDIDITIFVYPITGLEHGKDYFYVDYKVKIYDGNELIIISDDDDEYDGISLDSVYGSDRPFIENNTFSFDVKIPGNYIASVHDKKSDSEAETNENKMTGEKTKEHDLGTDVIYTRDRNNRAAEIEIDPTGPSELVLEDTFFDNTVATDKYLVVKMNKKSTPTFSAVLALERENMAGRGTSGLYNSDNDKDIKPFPGRSYDWSIMQDGSQPMIPEKDSEGKETGTYSYTWTFQGNNSGADKYGFLLDALAINGEAITVPFVPRLVIDGVHPVDPMEYPNAIDSTKTTIMSDGTIVEVEYIKVWRRDDNTTNQRAYQVRISNTRANLVVTNANFHVYRSNLELVPYNLKGINEFFVDGKKFNQSSVVALTSGVEPIIRFNLSNHYENPVVRYTNRKGDPFVESIKVSGPDEKGYYEATLPALYKADRYTADMYTIGLLYVEASPVKYAVQYDLNGVDAEFTSLFDDNNEQYYTIENSRVVTVSNKKPISDDYKFSHWEIENSNSETLKLGQVLNLDKVQSYAKRATTGTHAGKYILKLKAIWEKK